MCECVFVYKPVWCFYEYASVLCLYVRLCMHAFTHVQDALGGEKYLHSWLPGVSKYAGGVLDPGASS